jgi:hypothetical protein
VNRNSYQSGQSHYYSHFYLKTEQTHEDCAIRMAKRTEEALRQIFRSYHLYLMKALNLPVKPKESNHQVYNNHQQQQEYEKPKP